MALGEGCRVQDILVHPAPLKSSHTNNNNNNNEEFGGGGLTTGDPQENWGKIY